MLHELAAGDVGVEGRLVNASNLVLRVLVGESRVPACYKPVRGERELWDFPDGTLAGREVTSYLVAAAGGWSHVPETVLRADGPFGPGSVQRWVGPVALPDTDLVRLDPPERLPDGYLPVLAAETEDGQTLVVAHADDPRLASLAVLDVVLNNADRKGSHLIEEDGVLYGIDQGLTCHVEPKLRTVLWGWAGDPLPADDVLRLERLAAAMDDDLAVTLAEHLTHAEVEALRLRVDALLAAGVFPDPPELRPAVPWPLW